jgi:hypothetical protein
MSRALFGFASRILVALSIALLMPHGRPDAATVNAASCSNANVQSAVDSAAAGDVVTIPAGDCTWTSRVDVNKPVTLKGAGVGSTVIRNGINGVMLSLRIPESGTLYVSDITFDLMSRDTGSRGAIEMTAQGDNLNAFRFHHFEMLNQLKRGFYIFLEGYEVGGLIDHGRITSKGSKWISIEGTGPEEHQPFRRPLALGTNKFIFIEDNQIENISTNAQIDGWNDAYTGARYVLRYNRMTGCPAEVGHHGADSGFARGTHSFEVYSNAFTQTRNCNYTTRAINFRSGTGVVFNNTWTGRYGYGMHVTNYRSDESHAPWGKCDGTSRWDENVPGEKGWACLDQIGHVFGPTIGGANTLDPLYEWNNTINGRDADFINTNHNANVHVRPNRDYYDDTVRPGYMPYTYPHPLQGSASTPTPSPMPTTGPIQPSAR